MSRRSRLSEGVVLRLLTRSYKLLPSSTWTMPTASWFTSRLRCSMHCMASTMGALIKLPASTVSEAVTTRRYVPASLYFSLRSYGTFGSLLGNAVLEYSWTSSRKSCGGCSVSVSKVSMPRGQASPSPCSSAESANGNPRIFSRGSD